MKRKQDVFTGKRTLPLQHRIQRPGMVLPNKGGSIGPAPEVDYGILTEESPADFMATEENVNDLVLQEEAP